MDDGPAIVIAVAEGGYSVCIERHADAAHLNATHADHRSARGYAGGLKMTRGWPIIDKTGSQA